MALYQPPEATERKSQQACLCFFSCGCNEIHWQKQFKEERVYFGSQSEVLFHHDEEVLVSRAGGSQDVVMWSCDHGSYTQGAGHDEHWCLAHFLL